MNMICCTWSALLWKITAEATLNTARPSAA